MKFIGIDLGGTNIAAGLCDENGKLLKKVSIPTENDSGASVIKGLLEVCEVLAKETDLDRSEVKAIGIGVPGTANSATGTVVFTPNLPLSDVNIAKDLSAKWGIPVLLGNDANCAALGEVVAGGAKEASDAIFVTLGTGVGGGIVIGNKIIEGFNGCAGELGHNGIIMDGRECGCGRLGCWEAYASATGLIKTTREFMEKYPDSIMWEMTDRDLEKVSGRTAFDAKRKGDKAGTEAVALYTKHLAAGCIDMINIFQPEILVLGGGIANEGEYLLEPLREEIKRGWYKGAKKNTRILKAELGNDAGIVGAAMLGR